MRSRARALVQNLLLSAGSTLFFLATAEGICRALETPPDEEHRLRGVANWEDWGGEFYTIAGGIPGQDESNLDGLRDRPHAEGKPAGVRRVFCLGDSTTYGQHLRPEQAWPQRLQVLLDERSWTFEVFNVALPGWSARQQRIAYGRICRKYHPDQVLLAICLNDVPDLQNNLERPPRLVSWLFARSALVRRAVDPEARHIRGVQEMFLAGETPRVRDGYERLFAEIRGLKGDAHADGATLAVIVLPFRFQLAPDAPPPRPQGVLAAFCAREAIPFLDLLSAFRRAGPSAFVDEDHPSPAGAELIAANVFASGIVAHADAGESGDAAARTTVELARQLSSRDAHARLRAAHDLARRDGAGAPAVPALVGMLADPAPQFRAAAARALGGIGAAAVDAAPALAQALDDRDADVRLRAQEALFTIRPSPADVLGAVVRILEAPAAPGREEAARVAGRFGPEARGAVPALLAALEDPRPAVRQEAIWALGQIGPDAAPAAPALIALCEDRTVRWRVADALGGIGPEAHAAVPALAAALGDEDADVRRLSARALGRIGSAARPAAGQLAAALADARAGVRIAAARALARIDADPAIAVPALEGLAHDPSGGVRREAEAALRRLRRRSPATS
ncbi:MAG TPA: HEAT repeat domain-containing protein [Vicinamibacteria bacterium]|nr:HEAT repeat domain-containing protein [Vicinamibacteria bacterium]